MKNNKQNGYYPYHNPIHSFIPPGYHPYHLHQYMDPGFQSKNQQDPFLNEEKEKSSSSNDQKKENQKKMDEKTKEKGKPQKITKAMINFEKLQAGTLSNSSGIFNGKNIQFGWSSQSKSNSGFGSLGGHNNKANKNTNVVFDNDQIDTPIDDRDTMWSPIPPS